MGPTTSDLPAALSDALARAPVPGVVAAYLFGSHAAGRAHRESDVDVGVLFDWDALPTTRERFDAGVRLASWLMAELRHPRVDLVVLNDAPPVLARHVTVDGRLVRTTDAEREHAFRRDAQLRAADLEPFLRRTRELKRQALAR